MKIQIQLLLGATLLALTAHAQVNSGSNGSNGAFNPTKDTVIDMADHPDGIYQYTSVNISNNVTVTFIPNANNTPVVWLVQSNCVINGTIDLSAKGQSGGPGGYAGGNGGTTATAGQGPGGGAAGGNATSDRGGSYATGSSSYGNQYIIPLVGGSGGGGHTIVGNGFGGGGAILIAASANIEVNGLISGTGGPTPDFGGSPLGGGGSGGAVRLVASAIRGGGRIDVQGHQGGGPGGLGRVRFDSFNNNFGGVINGVWSQGYQPIILPVVGQGVQLNIVSVGGVLVSASPSGQLATPDAVLAAQQGNPIPIVVHCSNIPLNTQITLTVRPASGLAVSATGLNNTGTPSSSTATISITMPRGGGIIYATVAN